MIFFCFQIFQKANQILDKFMPYEARAEICPNFGWLFGRFKFWRHQNFVLRLTELYQALNFFKNYKVDSKFEGPLKIQLLRLFTFKINVLSLHVTKFKKYKSHDPKVQFCSNLSCSNKLLNRGGLWDPKLYFLKDFTCKNQRFLDQQNKNFDTTTQFPANL